MPKKVIGGKVEKRIPIDGIGGVFIYANDAKALSTWYAHHFGLKLETYEDGKVYGTEFKYSMLGHFWSSSKRTGSRSRRPRISIMGGSRGSRIPREIASSCTNLLTNNAATDRLQLNGCEPSVAEMPVRSSLRPDLSRLASGD